MARKSKNDNQENYDDLNPEAQSPQTKKILKQFRKLATQFAKIVAKIIKGIIQLLISLGPIGIVVLIVLVLIVLIVAFQHMPGMMKSKLAELFTLPELSSWFQNGASSDLSENYDDIINVANYLESMNYSLIGDGFVTPILNVEDSVLSISDVSKEHPDYTYKIDVNGVSHFYDSSGNIVSNLKYLNNIGQVIDNYTGNIDSDEEYTDKFGIIRTLSSEEAETGTAISTNGQVSRVEKDNLKNYRLIRTYLLSNYRIYNLKNLDEDILNKLANGFRTLTGGNYDGWAKGLIKLYTAEKGIADGDWWWARRIRGENVSIQGSNLVLKNGWGNREMSYSITGWAPRYGLSLDFLIALHLGTGAPDLTYAMVQNFDTEIQVYLDSEDAPVTAKFVDYENGSGNSWGELMAYGGIAGNPNNANSYAYQRILLGSGISSPSNCENLEEEGIACSDSPTLERCCSVCRRYVQRILAALTDVGNKYYKMYYPYIARVVGSWFRDTYFMIPEEEDAAIKSYAGDIVKPEYAEDVSGSEIRSTKHPEFDVANAYGPHATYVEVDEDYLSDSGEYWSKYVMKKDAEGNETNEYQLYVLRADGRTSDTTMEEFLDTGEIDGKAAEIHNKVVGPYKAPNDDNYEEARKLAEEDGWAFVKKAELKQYSELASESSIEDIPDGILWTAYEFGEKESDWVKVVREDGNDAVNNLYGLNSELETNQSLGVFYKMGKQITVIQKEDAQRGPTNSLVKYLFKYRKYYIYDGTEARGVMIEHDKQRILKGYEDYVREYDPQNSSDVNDTRGEYYRGKVLAEEGEFKDKNSLVYSTDDNFYHFQGLIGSNGLLRELYGNNWQSDVVNLLNQYGRSALRDTYSFGTTLTASFTASEEELAQQWLDWQLDMYYMDKFDVDLNSYYNISGGSSNYNNLLKLRYDPRDPDLISTVQITKTSLGIFSMLENTGSIDADYAYRDLKELIVELNYFDREELSQKVPTVFTWVLPDSGIAGWPRRPHDKINVDYGALFHSKDGYEALDSYITGQEISDSEDSEEPETSEEGSEKSDQISAFEGYETDDLVASPVTGRILEVGTHERKNIYTNELEEVEYVIIEVMDSKYFTSDMVSSSDYENNIPDENSYKDEYNSADKALNLFYDEYEDVCDGYTIMIDGFDVDFSLTDGENDGKYKQNEIKGFALANSKEEEKRIAKEQAKDDAPFFISYGVSGYPTPEANYKADLNSKVGYYVKEGKYIGKALDSTETLIPNRDYKPETEDSGEKLTYNYEGYEGPTDYIRMVIKDLDSAIVDNVEDFFDIPELGGANGINSPQKYQAQEGDLELLASLMHHEGCEKTFARRLNSDELGKAASRATGYVVINRAILNFGNYGTTIRDQISAPGQYSTKNTVLSSSVTCEACLANAEWCLTYDCSSVVSPTTNIPMPRNVVGQSGNCQCSSDIGKFNCWWRVDMVANGKPDQYKDVGRPYDTFYCVNTKYPAEY